MPAHRRRLWIGLALFLIAAPLLFVVQQALATLQTLTRVERERDSWQRPERVLQPINLRPGTTVVDLGSGAGYFALKMAPRVAPRGRVLAVDLRRQSLAFLWVRALMDGHTNLHVIRGDVDDPHLPPGPIDAVLIANTFHELSMPEAVLRSVFRAMRPGAIAVAVDRAPHEGSRSSDRDALHHHIAAATAVRIMETVGFKAVSQDDDFIDRDPEGDRWWLVTLSKAGPDPGQDSARER
jgi:predicted methyltransferase